MDFCARLRAAAREQVSWLCIGLDPEPERVPDAELVPFCRTIVEATADLVCAFKPNFAFFLARGVAGLDALLQVMETVPDQVPIIGDVKMGDIGSTSRQYARACFDEIGFDAVTVNPYLGRDALEPFFTYRDRGVFVLCKTSNPGSGDFQDVYCQGPSPEEGEPLYERVARAVARWNTGNLGLVVGATYPEQLARVRRICPTLPILIPGVGAQGGDLLASIRAGVDAEGGNAIVSATRQVIYAGAGRELGPAARRAATGLRDQINRAIAEARRGPAEESR
ncbi:MAG: orotidine-5'-phosphate decarboxylase [Chloroflexi bacterium]|nr:orotidine-5'-phosphate decarboxylase [Chloroflexota bacterium]